MEPCRLRRGEHSGISSEDVATSEGSFGRTSEGHRPVELIRNQPLDDFPACNTCDNSRGVEDK